MTRWTIKDVMVKCRLSIITKSRIKLQSHFSFYSPPSHNGIVPIMQFVSYRVISNTGAFSKLCLACFLPQVWADFTEKQPATSMTTIMNHNWILFGPHSNLMGQNIDPRSTCHDRCVWLVRSDSWPSRPSTIVIVSEYGPCIMVVSMLVWPHKL